MTLKELILTFRQISDDLAATPHLWTHDELVGYANIAERDAARRALLLMDVETSAVCDYSVLAGNPLIALDPRVVAVRRVRLVSAAQPLALRGWREVDELSPGWETQSGPPVLAIPDWQSNALRLSPIPQANDLARAAVFRLPLNDMQALDDSPEINVRYHRGLVNSMLAQGYSKHDTETFDPQAATFFAALFEAEFGPLPSAASEAQATRDVSRTRHAAPR